MDGRLRFGGFAVCVFGRTCFLFSHAHEIGSSAAQDVAYRATNWKGIIGRNSAVITTYLHIYLSFFAPSENKTVTEMLEDNRDSKIRAYPDIRMQLAVMNIANFIHRIKSWNPSATPQPLALAWVPAYQLS